MRGPERSEPAFDGSYVHVEIEHWPEGPYEVVRQHGAAAIVALTPDDEVVLVRQFRPPVRDDLVASDASDVLEVPDARRVEHDLGDRQLRRLGGLGGDL